MKVKLVTLRVKSWNVGKESLRGIYKEDRWKQRWTIKRMCRITFPRPALLIKNPGVKGVSQNTQSVNGLVADSSNYDVKFLNFHIIV